MLILGSQGMAGHILMRYFAQQGFKVTGVARKIYSTFGREILLDVTDFDGLKLLLQQESFDIVINAIGVLMGDSIKSFDNALNLNGRLPQILQQWSQELDFKLILISTDCVFDGKIGAYSEKDIPNASDAYGLSKRIGEVVNDPNTLTIRTSIIGPELKSGTGLWQWFESQKGIISGFTSVYWSGVTTLELSKFLFFAIQNELAGLKQLSNGIPISKYDLLKTMQKAGINPNLNVETKDNPKSNKSLIASNLHGYMVPSYQLMIKESLSFYGK